MLHFPGFRSVQQANNEGTIEFKFFFSVNHLSKYGILMLVNSWWFCDISSHIPRRSCTRTSSTSFTLLSSVDVFGLPGLGSSFKVRRPSRKRIAQRVRCLLTTNCTTVHCLLTTNCTTVNCLLTTNCTAVHCLLTTNCTTVHCLLTTNCTTVHCLLTTNCTISDLQPSN